MSFALSFVSRVVNASSNVAQVQVNNVGSLLRLERSRSKAINIDIWVYDLHFAVGLNFAIRSDFVIVSINYIVWGNSRVIYEGRNNFSMVLEMRIQVRNAFNARFTVNLMFLSAF